MEQSTNLTRNEKRVLSMLLDDARVNDSEIAKKIKLSPQGVRKIRLKLEKNYISQYRTIINYEKLGIRVFAIAQMRIKDKEILENKHIIGAFEINEANITHFLILGFSSIEDIDHFKSTLVQKAEIKKINVLSNRSFLKNSPAQLIKSYLK